ncbi:MAG: LytTR family DNA-binding domain-containing protein, partial [Fulvivirga sp.]|uniref:LytR/AlgR family response regulator transcription factor n=1 Tax=Fulvivirga sp. TaxID=1931237 RepID=UPI0032EEC1ED
FIILQIALFSMVGGLTYSNSIHEFYYSFGIHATGLLPLNIFFYIALILYVIPHSSAKDNDIIFLKEKENKLVKVELNQVIYIKAQQNYVEIRLNTFNNGRLLIRNSISKLEKQLAYLPNFVRQHRSYIINTNYLQELRKSDNGTDWNSVMIDDEIIPISRNKKNEIITILKSH